MRALVLALLLGACVTPPAPAQPAPQEDTCGMARFAHLVGTRADQIDRSTLPPHTRIIHPNTAVTMDYSAERLNIQVGADGRVTSLGCF